MSAPPPFWTDALAWSLLLIQVTLCLHAIGLVMIGLALRRIGVLGDPRTSHLQVVVVSIALINGVGLILAVLHGLEATIWAGTYLWLGALSSLHDAILYSVDSLTARGKVSVTLENNWKLMGALEAANGLLLFGISTAFLFTILTKVWQALARFDPRTGSLEGSERDIG